MGISRNGFPTKHDNFGMVRDTPIAMDIPKCSAERNNICGTETVTAPKFLHLRRSRSGRVAAACAYCSYKCRFHRNSETHMKPLSPRPRIKRPGANGRPMGRPVHYKWNTGCIWSGARYVMFRYSPIILRMYGCRRAESCSFLCISGS